MAKTQSEEILEEEDAESEDSSEEATEEDTEDSESESEEESSEDGKSDEASEKEESPEEFLSVGKLPKELAPIGKKMLASHTKKMQQLKKDFDDRAMELSTRYARAIRSEKALEVLSEQEAFKMFLDDARAGRPYGHSSIYNRGTTVKEEESSSDEKGATSVNGIMKQLAPMIEKTVARSMEPFLKSHANQTRAQLEKSLPNFNKYRPEIEELVQSEGLSVERAYQIASEKDRVADAIEKAVTKGKADIKRIPRTEGKSTAGNSELTVKPAKNLREALNFAASRLGTG